MEKWNRLTDLRGEEGGEDGKQSTKKYICIYAQPMDRDNNVINA